MLTLPLELRRLWLAPSKLVGATRAFSDAIEAALLANHAELPTAAAVAVAGTVDAPVVLAALGPGTGCF